MSKVLVTVLLAGLFLALYFGIYQIFCMAGQYELVKKAWEASVNLLTCKNKRRKTIERESFSLYGEMESKSLIAKIDALLSYSGILGRHSWLTAEVFAAGMLLMGVGEMLMCLLLLRSFFSSFVIVFATGFILYEIGNTMRMLRRKQINEELLHFEDLMEIYAFTNDDILQIIGKSAMKIKGPLQKELFRALYEAQNSGQISLALRRLCNRVENKYFKDLILNLEICSRYLTNYRDVLQAGKKILKQAEQNRKRMQKIYRKSLMFIAMFLVIGGVSIYAMGIFAGVEGSLLSFLWKSGTLPRGIVIYLAAVALLGLWKISTKVLL